MKILLKESQLPNGMKIFVKENFPNLLKPFSLKYSREKKNSGWGSQMHDYYIITTFYVDYDETIIVKEHDDRDNRESSKYVVDENIKILYDFFGEELFEEFFREEHNIDLRQRGNFKTDWYFF